MPKPELKDIFFFWSLMIGSALIICLGIFGLFHFFSEPPNKWMILSLLFCVLGVGGVILIGSMKNDFLYPEPTLESDKIENKPVAEQRRIYWQCVYFTVVAGFVVLPLGWFLASLFERSPRSTAGFLMAEIVFFLCLFGFRLFKLHNK